MGLNIFDLDGTLVDPLEAMVHGVQETCRELGLGAPARAEVARFIGFGAGELFAGLAGPDRLDEAIRHYWSHFEETGSARHRIYDGVPLMLSRLKRQGHRLYLVTVKPARQARRLLHEFDILLSFDEVFGSAPGAGFKTKAEVLDQLRTQGVVQPGGYMVGDRADDMAFGAAVGLAPLGVTYGYGSPMELRDAGAAHLFDTPEDLDNWFRINLPGSEIHDAFSLSE